MGSDGRPIFAKGRMSRRAFCAGVGGTAALFALGAVELSCEEYLVRPPGGQDFDQLLARCLRCGKCIEACPRHVVVMAGLEDGFFSQRTPMLEFSASWCDRCAEEGGVPKCIETCPTAALELAAGTSAEGAILGIAEIDTSTCLAHRDMSCRYCYDACPYDAIELDGNGWPQIVTDACNGCGACEAACVSLQSGSVTSATGERAVMVRALDGNGNLVNSFQSEGGAL